MVEFLQTLVHGILDGLIYAMVAAGLSLIWGVMDVINFAHGEFLMAAMYLSFWAGSVMGVDPLVSWAGSGVFTFLLGVITFKLIVRHCIKKSSMAALLATFGLSLVLKNACLNLFTPNFRLLQATLLGQRKIELGGIVIPVPQLVAGLFALLIVFGLYFFLKRTRTGWAIQATAMDREAAELMGIDTEGILTLVFGLSAACVGIAGGLLPMFLSVHPEVGGLFSLIAFVCVALGGFGSVFGALLASVLVGVVESVVGFYFAPVFKYVSVFALYLLVIFWRPKGLFGW